MCSVSLGAEEPHEPGEAEMEKSSEEPSSQPNGQEPFGQLVCAKQEGADDHKPQLYVENGMGNVEEVKIRVEHAMNDVKLETGCPEKEHSENEGPATPEEVQDTPAGDENVREPAGCQADVPKSFHCSKCSYKCLTSFHLKMHGRKHTGEKQPRTTQSSCESVESPEPTGQNDSEEQPSSEGTLEERTQLEMFHCVNCSYTGATKALLRRHMRRHNEAKVLKCTDCSFVSADAAILRMHVRKHTGEKPVHCPHCPYDCATSSQLKRHMRRHSGEKPFRCTECSYVCADATNLKNHIRTHTGENRLRCTRCTYTCVTSTHLKRHMRSHTGEKPFGCEQCDAAFAQSGDLKRHVRRHTGERPYACAECGLEFSQSSTLNKHKRTHRKASSCRARVRKTDRAPSARADSFSCTGEGSC